MSTLRKTRDCIWMDMKPLRLAEGVLWIQATSLFTFAGLKVLGLAQARGRGCRQFWSID